MGNGIKDFFDAMDEGLSLASEAVKPASSTRYEWRQTPREFNGRTIQVLHAYLEDGPLCSVQVELAQPFDTSGELAVVCVACLCIVQEGQ